MAIEAHQALHSFAGSFDDIGALGAAVGTWDLDFRQLDRGDLEADIEQLGTSSIVLNRVRFSRALDQRGCPPAGMLTFGVLEDGSPRIRWHGLETRDESLLSFNGFGGFESLSGAGHHAYTLTIAESHLRLVAERLGLPGIPREMIDPPHRLREAAAPVARLRRGIRGLYRASCRQPARMAGRRLREALELELPRLLVEALCVPSVREERPDSPPSRRLALNRAREFIRENLRQAPTVRQVCEHSGFSWRTLDYAFREHTGMTPQAYLRAVRLDELRRLLRSGAYATVGEAAHACGFWHMGKLAADYRAQFGELPSETLRGRRGPGVSRETRARAAG